MVFMSVTTKLFLSQPGDLDVSKHCLDCLLNTAVGCFNGYLVNIAMFFMQSVVSDFSADQ